MLALIVALTIAPSELDGGDDRHDDVIVELDRELGGDSVRDVEILVNPAAVKEKDRSK